MSWNRLGRLWTAGLDLVSEIADMWSVGGGGERGEGGGEGLE